MFSCRALGLSSVVWSGNSFRYVEFVFLFFLSYVAYALLVVVHVWDWGFKGRSGMGRFAGVLR